MANATPASKSGTTAVVGLQHIIELDLMRIWIWLIWINVDSIEWMEDNTAGLTWICIRIETYV